MLRSVNRVRAFITELRCVNLMSSAAGQMSERHLAEGDPLPPVDPNCMRLYKMRFCPYAQRMGLILKHKKIAHETVFVNLKDKPDWLFELNPLGAVPVLQHKGHVVYESAVCAEFLEEAFPGSLTGTHDLLPSSPYERAAVRLLILKFNKIFPSAFGIVRESDNPSKRLELEETLRSSLEDLEYHLATADEQFLGGSNYGMADLHFYPVFERLPAIRMFGVDVFSADRFPRLGAWTSTMQQLDLVRKFWISPKMYYQFMVGRKAGDPPYDMETDDETMAVQNSVA